MNKSITCLVLLLSAVATTHAAFWKCELPGGVYTVSLPTVSSVSSHEYIVDGAARVTEVTIGTTGSLIARFYYIEPVQIQSPIGVGQSILDRAQEKIEEGAERVTPPEAWKKVVKSYPTTTHAHTVEYRLQQKDQLTKILNSIDRAWRNNNDVTLKIESSTQ